MSDPNTLPDPLVEFFLEAAKGLSKALWAQTIGRGKKEIDLKRAARRYREAITKNYRDVHIFGQARPTDLLDIFTDVNVLKKPVALKRYDIQSLQEWFAGREQRASLHEREERMPGLDALDRTQKLFILGKPGAGKTTFMKYLAVMAAGGSARLPYIPIFVELKKYADSGDDLLTFIAHQFDICKFEDATPFIKRVLKKGKALALFDGLDEVSAGDGRRDEVIAALRDFSQKYDDNKIVITCRVAAADYMFEGFEYVEMADFTPQQVEAFIPRWFADEPDLAQKMLDELARPKNNSVLALTRTPLLLVLTCITFAGKKRLPEKKSELYEEGVDILLQEWDEAKEIQRDKIYRNMKPRRREHMLSVLAFESFVRNEYFVPVRKLENRISRYLADVYKDDELDIDVRSVLKAIAAQHGLLVEGPHRYYSFPHLTFQEYFTARYIVDNEARGAVDDLVQHAFDDRWREVFLLVASMLDDPDVFFKRFLSALDQYAMENDLTPLLAWAEAKRIELEDAIRADAAQRGIEPIIYHPATGRAWVVSLARDYDFDRVLDHDSALNIHRVLHLLPDPLAVNRNRLLDLDSDLVLDLILNRPFHLDYAFALILTRDRDLVRDLVRDLIRLLYLDHFLLGFDGSHDNSLDNLFKALQNMQRPTLENPIQTWQEFCTDLETAIKQYRPSAWILNRAMTEAQIPADFERKDWGAIAGYMKGVTLLIDCLDVAYVTNRRVIEERLLLPPTEH